MRRSCLAFLATTALSAGFAGSAGAADIPLKAPIQRPLPAAVYNWTGCYLGVHGGGGVMYDQWVFLNGSGGIAGGQAGCNYQTGPLVVGIEAEGWWSGLSSKSDDGFTVTTAKNRWDADVALRAGLAVDRTLFYVKAGGAVGRFDVTYDDADRNFNRGSDTLIGALLGTGIEYAFAANWSAKLEYDYIGYVGKDFRLTTQAFPFEETVSATKHIVKAGINYKFGEPSPGPAAGDMPLKAQIYKAPAFARAYNWTGCYIGAHGGGGVMFDPWTDINGGGGLAGGQLGCNYQTGAIVVGVEGEGWWSGLASHTVFGNSPAPGTATIFSGSHNHWDADVALRAGLAVDRVLVYHKVGAAWGAFDFSFDQTPNSEFQRGNGTLAGLLLGTGLEYAFADHWTAKLEYDYVGYVGKDVSFAAGGPQVHPGTRTVSATEHIAKAGLNYKFGEATATRAADMSMPPAAGANWTGCYVGAHAGGGVLDDTWAGPNGANGLAGGQLGCNYGSGHLVLGVEGEGWWSALASRSAFSRADGSESSEGTNRNRWDADVALRAGLAVDRALLYAKAGAAWGRFEVASSFSDGETQRASFTLGGILLGTGLEYALAANWSAKIEYDYINYLNRHTVIVDNMGPPFDAQVSATKHVAKVGLNYRFGAEPAPVVTKY